MTNLDWNEFCELYYETAKRMADAQLEKLRGTLGGLDRRVDELKKEAKAAARKRDVDTVKAVVQTIADDGPDKARARLLPRLTEALGRLSAADQVILDFYLEDRSTYVEKSAEALHISKGYVSVRRNRIFSLLRELMEMTPGEYRRHCYEYDENALAATDGILLQRNPIRPSLEIEVLARKILAEFAAL